MLSSGDRAGAATQRGHVAIVFLPGPPLGNKGPSMIKRLSRREQLALGFMSATQGAYRPPQVLLDISAGSRVALSLYDFKLPPGIRLDVEHGRGQVARWRRILRRADSVPADIVPGTLAGAARAAGRSFAYLGIGEASHRDAIAAADRGGVVEPVLTTTAREAGRRALALWRSEDAIVADLPGGNVGYRALDLLLAKRRATDVLIVVQKPQHAARRLLAVGGAGLGDGTALESGSTRRAGLIVTTDIAPTALKRIGVDVPGQVQGQPIEASSDRSVKRISSLRGRFTQVGPRRWKTSIGGLLVAIVVIAAFGLRRRDRWLPRVGRAAFLSLLWLPAVLLATGAFSTTRLGEMLLIGLGCATLALVSELVVAWPRTPLIPAGVTVVAHLVDLAFGSGLIARSLLGPNPILGARFYGIGNELEITLAVTALIGIGAAVARSRARSRVWSFVIVGGLLTLLLSWGRLGADVGASLTLGVGVATAAVISLEGTSLRRRIAIVALAPAVALATLALVDILTGGDSHFTRSVLRAGGVHDLGDVFQRKLESSYGSLTRGIIPLLSLAAVVAIVAGTVNRGRLLRPIADCPGLRAGLYGALAAVIAGVLTNDSGPVILLIGSVYLALAVGYVRSGPNPGASGAEPAPGPQKSPNNR